MNRPTIAAMLTSTIIAAALATAADEIRGVVSVEPVGLLLLGPTLEAEIAVGESFGLVAGVQQMAWGMLANAMSEEQGYPIREATLYVAGMRVYREAKARLTGFYAGPRFEMGPVSAGDVDAYSAFLMADLGYRRLVGNHCCCTVSLQAGGAAAWHKDGGITDPDTRYYPIGQAGLSLGYAF